MRRLILAFALVSLASVANANWWSEYNSFRCAKERLVHFDGTIAEAAIATPELSTLVFALETAGLVDAVNGDGNLTVYAPTNDAFANIPEMILGEVLADPDALEATLLYHVTPGLKDPRRVHRVKPKNTLLGQKVFYNRGEDGPMVNNANVQCQGVRADNGVVWIIDSVLMPQF